LVEPDLSPAVKPTSPRVWVCCGCEKEVLCNKMIHSKF